MQTSSDRPADLTSPEDPVRRQGAALGWWAVAVSAVLAVVAMRLAREPRFFYWDDTQLGAVGQWYGLGARLLSGDIPILSPGAWQGGNYLAEGQWGVWNPLVWVIALAMHISGSATLVATAVKVAFLLIFCTGAFLLARSYGAKPWWAALAGFSVAMGGQTMYMDAPSWVTGLQSVAVFALVWWALKRHLDEGRSAVPYFLFTYVLITFGYVFGVIELAALLITMLVAALVVKDARRARRIFVLGVYAAGLTVFVYLPGILTSGVTSRAGNDILNDQFLNMDLGDLATSSISTAVSSVRGYWGDLLPVPLQYASWLLPVLILVAAGWRASLRRTIVPLVLLVFTLALVVGPSVLGPLRYPARMMPYAVLCLMVVFAVVASRGWPERPTRGRVLAAVAVTAVCGWLAWAAQPASALWVIIATVLQAGVILLVGSSWVAERRGPAGRSAAVLLLAGSLVVLFPQVARYPSSPLGNFNVPSSVEQMHAVGDSFEPGIFTVGDVYSLQRSPDAYRESLLANLWYFTGKDAASVYTVLPFRTFAEELCVDLRGATCPEALDALFDPDAPLADDLALNTVVVIKGEGLERPEDWGVPEGWRVDEREYTWTLKRIDPVDPAGGFARVSPGVGVSDVRTGDTFVEFTLDEAPADGAEIVFSRLAWPGYSVSAGELAEPDRGFLLTLAVDEAQVGERIRLEFRPPGWALELSAVVLSAATALGYLLLVRRRSAAVDHV